MGWKYSVMHLDREVATMGENGLCTIMEPDFMPFNLYLEEEEDVSTCVNNLNNFYYWCASRVLTLDRVYAKAILNAIGAGQGRTDRDRAKIALHCHCVTLTDVYWTRAVGEPVSFQDLNLYEHPLADAFVDVSLFGKTPTAQNAELLQPMDYAGDVSTQGAVPKAWIRRGGSFYLLKDGGMRDVEAELLASRIVRCFDVEQVLYEPFVYQGQRVSSSRLMTSTERGIVPAEYVAIHAINQDTTLHRVVEQYDAEGFHRMNIIDYLTGNTDRHWGNWGFLVDHRTNRLLRLHPLMDFNKSFLAYDTLEGARCLTTESGMSQKEAALRGMEKAGIRQVAEIRREWFDGFADANVWEMFCRRMEVLFGAGCQPFEAVRSVEPGSSQCRES